MDRAHPPAGSQAAGPVWRPPSDLRGGLAGSPEESGTPPWVRCAWPSVPHVYLFLVVVLAVGEAVLGAEGRGGGGRGGRQAAGSRPGRREIGLELGHAGQLLQRRRGQLLEGLHVGLHLLQVALQLGAPVLEPGDDLGIAQPQLRRDVVSVGRRQVLLVEEALFQLVDLVVGEGRAGLPALLGRLPRPEGAQRVSPCGRRRPGGRRSAAGQSPGGQQRTGPAPSAPSSAAHPARPSAPPKRPALHPHWPGGRGPERSRRPPQGLPPFGGTGLRRSFRTVRASVMRTGFRAPPRQSLSLAPR